MARSIVNQTAQIQKETTPGTAVTTAMKKLPSLKLMPSFNVDSTQEFKANGRKVNTIVQLGDIWSTWSVDGIQDFNTIGFILASVVGAPVTTTPAGGTNARQHVFSLNPSGPDVAATYTAQYGDTTKCVQSSYFTFQGLELGIERGNLSLSSSAISRKYDATATLVTAGVTSVAPAPIPSTGYDVYADDTWAGLGTTKLLAAYSGNVNLGDKFTPDRPINSQVQGFESLLESEDISYGGSLSLGFDATGTAMLTTMTNEAVKFLRFGVTGTTIETTIKYTLFVDVAVRITNIGEITKAPNSPAICLPFDYTIVEDPTSGKAVQFTLINTATGY